MWQAWLQKYLYQYNTGLGTEADKSLLRRMTAKEDQDVLAARSRHLYVPKGHMENITHNYTKVFPVHLIAKT